MSPVVLSGDSKETDAPVPKGGLAGCDVRRTQSVGKAESFIMRLLKVVFGCGEVQM